LEPLKPPLIKPWVPLRLMAYKVFMNEWPFLLLMILESSPQSDLSLL
jgi:hypothetical protein